MSPIVLRVVDNTVYGCPVVCQDWDEAVRVFKETVCKQLPAALQWEEERWRCHLDVGYLDIEEERDTVVITWTR